MYVHEEQTLHVIDFENRHQSLILIPMEMFRDHERQHAPGKGPGLWVERQQVSMVSDLSKSHGILIFVRTGSYLVLILNLVLDTMSVVDVGIEIDNLEVVAPSLFWITRCANEDYFERSRQSSTGPINDHFLLHAEGDRLSRRSDVRIDVAEVSADWNQDNRDSSIQYDTFLVEKVHREHQPSRLHAEHSYVSPHLMLDEQLPLIHGGPTERRFAYSKGTVAQVVHGLCEVFDFNNLGTASMSSVAVRSYLRTLSTSATGNQEVVANTRYLGNACVLCNVLLKPSTGRSNYMGYSQTATLEVVDIERQQLRQISFELADTSMNAATGRVGLFAGKFMEEDEEVDNPLDQSAQYDISAEGKDVDHQQRYRRQFLFSLELENGNFLLLDRTGVARVFQVDSTQLEKAYANWKSMVGCENQGIPLELEFDDDPFDEDEDGFEEVENIEAQGELTISEDGEVEGEGEMVFVREHTRKHSSKQVQRQSRRASRNSSRKSRSQASSKKGGSGPQQQGEGGQTGTGGSGGQGSGGSGGQGSGGSGGNGDAMSIPEPGQFKGPRRLSDYNKKQVEDRISDLKNMLKLFPHDERLENELDELQARLLEGAKAEAQADPDADIRTRLQTMRSRLATLQQQTLDVRLEMEVDQLRRSIEDLERELGDRISGKVEVPGRAKRAALSEDAEAMREAKQVAKKISEESWKSLLEDLEMNPQDSNIYLRYVESVRPEINELRATLDSMQAKQNERVWLRNKDAGDLDERRLIDGLTGDRNVYKRRGDRPPDPYSFQTLPKRLTFVFDVSSSMAHYAMDGRLERTLEAATMIMESFKNYDHKFRYKFRGHSGSTDDLVFVQEPKYPVNQVQRLNVLRAMNGHAESCGSGDNTLDAARLAIREISKEESDESFVILLSDANLEQYDISPADLQALLNLDERVNVFILFIGTMGEQAMRLRAALPADRVFVTLQTCDIPKVLKRVFLSSVLKQA